ncbi:MAG: MobC family plasmid mobilization relaxosome protein [Clostridiales bacterium]|nr:MobC family plasmid mobilization relaxosome protein [Clostridiales bacterium]
MANKTVWKAFRCTDEEAAELSRQAEKNRLSESEYIRRKVFMLPQETNLLLQELKHYDLKIGNNINQVVRSCNSKKFISSYDYQKLVEYLEKLDEKYYELIRQLKEQNENRFYLAGLTYQPGNGYEGEEQNSDSDSDSEEWMVGEDYEKSTDSSDGKGG